MPQFFEGDGGAGGERTRLEAGVHALSQFGQTIKRGRSGHKAPDRPAGDDVGGRTALGHDAVQLVAGPELLAKKAEGYLGDRERVEGVDALPRGGGGVGLFSR